VPGAAWFRVVPRGAVERRKAQCSVVPSANSPEKRLLSRLAHFVSIPSRKEKRMKKLLLFASILALALAGCQKKEEPKPAEPPKAEAPAPAPAAPAAPAADAKDGAAPAAAPAADAKDGKDAAPGDPAKK